MSLTLMSLTLMSLTLISLTLLSLTLMSLTILVYDIFGSWHVRFWHKSLWHNFFDMNGSDITVWQSVYSHKSDFRKMCVNACQNNLKLPFFIGFKNGLCHLDSIFMPFPKWGLRFLYLKNWRSYKAKCKFNSILYTFCKNGSGDHIHAPNFENRVYFFPQGTKLSAENVFRANSYG